MICPHRERRRHIVAGRLSVPETGLQRSEEELVTSTAASDTTLQTGQTKNLLLALLGFTITFWAWNIIAPLGTRYSAELGLSATKTSLLVAMPVLVGSLGRVPVGALTDRLWWAADVHSAHSRVSSSRTAGCLRGFAEVRTHCSWCSASSLA